MFSIYVYRVELYTNFIVIIIFIIISIGIISVMRFVWTPLSYTIIKPRFYNVPNFTEDDQQEPENQEVPPPEEEPEHISPENKTADNNNTMWQRLINGFIQQASTTEPSPETSPEKPMRNGDVGEETEIRKTKRWPTDKAYFIAKELLMTERTYKKDLDVINVVSIFFFFSLLIDSFIKSDMYNVMRVNELLKIK